jgi:hypothetical protein
MKRIDISLNKDERDYLIRLLHRGKHSPAEYRNAIILLDCDESMPNHKITTSQISLLINTSPRTIERVKKRYLTLGIESAVFRNTSSRTYFHKTETSFKSKLIELTRREPPRGYKRWSLRLLADKVTELNIIPSISHETIRQILKKHHMKL